MPSVDVAKCAPGMHVFQYSHITHCMPFGSAVNYPPSVYLPAPSLMGFLRQLLSAHVVLPVPPILYFLQNRSYPHDSWLKRTRQQSLPVVTGFQNDGNQATLHSVRVLCDSFAAVDLERQWERGTRRYVLTLRSPIICTVSLTLVTDKLNAQILVL